MTDPRNLHDAAPGPSDEAVLADGRPVIRCGCGFLAVSDDPWENRCALDSHSCPAAPGRPVVHRTEPWYAPLFSLWGFLIVVALCSAILAGMGVKW